MKEPLCEVHVKHELLLAWTDSVGAVRRRDTDGKIRHWHALWSRFWNQKMTLGSVRASSLRYNDVPFSRTIQKNQWRADFDCRTKIRNKYV